MPSSDENRFIALHRLGDGAYLHLGDPEEEAVVITVVGVPDAGMAGMNVLLLSW